MGLRRLSLRIGTRERGFSNGNKGEKRVKPNWKIRGGEAYRGGSYWSSVLVWLKRENNVLIRSVIVFCVSIEGSESSNVLRWEGFVDSAWASVVRLIDHWCFIRRLIIAISRLLCGYFKT